jgi:hypothetical protein
MTSDGHKRFLLPKQEQEFETKRELVGLFKQGPLETDQQFAQRIMKAFQEYVLPQLRFSKLLTSSFHLITSSQVLLSKIPITEEWFTFPPFRKKPQQPQQVQHTIEGTLRGKGHGYRIWRFRLIQLTPKDSELLDGGDSSSGKTSRKDVIVSRVIRSSAIGDRVKTIHQNRCQVCGTAVETKTGTYAECCHIKPLGLPHDGPDVLGNVLCLCPNCHAAFDGFGFTISDDFAISTTGERLRSSGAHTINKEFLAYHRSLSGSST